MTETIEYKNRRFELSTRPHPRLPLLAKAWRGKAKNYYAYFAFPTDEKRSAWIDEQKSAADADERYKAEQKERRAKDTAEFLAQVKVGSLFSYAWGWEQTNLEYYEAVGVRGHSVTLRRIGMEMVEATCWAAGNFIPLPGQFLTDYPPIEKRITGPGIKFDFGYGYLTEPGQKHYCSWYA